jgi:ubiquinone/menaquinone biosynthesis C-methylase UbiE
MYYRLFKSFYGMAAKRMCRDCQNFIKKGSKILDLGCGPGIAGKTFQEFFQANLLGVDIKDRRINDIPFQLIDGKTLPFPENSFDVTLINYVLHHSQDPIALLKEAKRVTRDKIIIFEDLNQGYLSKLFCWLHGISYDKLFGNPTKTSFNSEKGWEKIFKELGLNIVFKKRISNFPVKKELFICQA